jgi:hypothetical protein
MPEPVVLTQDAITVPESEGLTFLDSILMLATNQYFPILTTDNAVIQASLDILQLATLLRTWRHTKYDAESKTTKAVKGLLNLVVYDNQTSWQALRTLFTCVSTFKSQDFENLHRVRTIITQTISTNSQYLCYKRNRIVPNLIPNVIHDLYLDHWPSNATKILPCHGRHGKINNSPRTALCGIRKNAPGPTRTSPHQCSDTTPTAKYGTSPSRDTICN